MSSPAIAVPAAVLLLAALSGCAPPQDGPAVASTPGSDRTPYAGSLDPAASAVPGDAGIAGLVVRCSTSPRGGTEASPYTDGAVARTPAGALRVAWGEGLLELATDALAQERADPDRILFTTAYRGVARQAVIVRHGPAGPGTGADEDGLGWYVESWAVCDLADFPEAVSSAAGVRVWTDAAGRRLPTTTIVSATGPEHCDWQRMTFLDLDGGMNHAKGETFIGEPEHSLTKYVGDGAAASLRLPDDAVDSGWSRGGDHLWFAPDRALAYVGTRDDVAAWPRVVRPFGCA